MTVVRAAAVISCLLAGVSVANAQQCGGDFGSFLEGVRQEATSAGISNTAIEEALSGVRQDPKVLARDRSQGVFAQSWGEFASRMVSSDRMTRGKSNLKKYADLFDRIEAETGVPGPVIASFWGLETDFGAVLGDFNTLNALATLAHDCRRPEIFRPHLIAAIRLVESGNMTPSEMRGAWAGEIGQTQLLPEEYLRFGTDADGNGRVNLRTDTPDVLFTTGKFIGSLRWRAAEPWLQEVRMPADFPLERAGLGRKEPRQNFASLGVTAADGSALPSDGLEASLVLPMGRNGPAFLAYPNFDIYLEWNQSLVYSLTAAYFAARLNGAGPVDMGSPEPGLDMDAMKQLQTRLQGLGHNVGKVDGILGENTRAAVRAEQLRLGLPADAWPTRELLRAL